MTFFPRTLNTGCGCDSADALATLISLDEALAHIERSVSPVSGTEEVALCAAKGRVLARPICARADMPRFDHAAMDGYALRAADLCGPGPWRLPVAGRYAAGDEVLDRLPSGAAARIFTGAPVPAGSDCVVMQEHVCQKGDHILLNHAPLPGDNIRARGEEHRKGTEILTTGTRMTARAIAAVAASGHGRIPVRRPIRVTLIVTGSEVTSPGARGLNGADIWDVNTPMLHAALMRAGVDLIGIVAVADDRVEICQRLRDAAARSDLIVSTGGVSVGEEDHLHAALRNAGGEIAFAGVAIKPGKPVTLGKLGRALWLGLPGNPQAAFVTWTLFGEAVLAQLSGLGAPALARRNVVLAHPISRKPGRCEIRPARLSGTDGTGRDGIQCAQGGNSGQMTALAAADGLAFLPADADHLPAGALVEFLPLHPERD